MSQESIHSQPNPNFSQKQYPLLHDVQLRGGVKHFTLAELQELAAELRHSLLEVVQFTGGHLASNLGIVELTIALHYVFDSPNDAFLWDVGHQAYVHKMLTGRWQDFRSLRQKAGLSGFPRRDESMHDYLNAGHAGTALSAALGLELGRNLNLSPDAPHGSPRTSKVLCVLGDASLTSGMAFEAMNHSDHQKNSLLVVLNDNEMSIAANVGAISRILSRLTAGASYVFIRNQINQFVQGIPFVGAKAYATLLRIKGTIKKAFYRTNLFTEFGFKYIGPIDGHNIKLLVDTLRRTALLEEPTFLHVSTQKGKGLKEAEKAPTKYHGIKPQLRPAASASSPSGRQQQAELSPVPTLQFAGSFTQCFSAALLQLETQFPQLVCISAAMAESTGLEPFAALHPERFFDVGIAEQHAITLAAGLAFTGKLPLVAIYSTFMQRALDQLIHDICLMHLPVIFICDRAGIVPGDGDTHQGIYDIAHFRSIIGLKLYSPATKQQFQACLAESMREAQQEILAWHQRCQTQGQHDFHGTPVILRIPKRNCPDLPSTATTTFQFFAALERPYAHTHTHFHGKLRRVLLLCTGSLLPEALHAQYLATRQTDALLSLQVDVLQLCQLAPLPLELLAEYWAAQPPYVAIFCTEDAVLQGGIGEEILRQFMLQSQRFVPVYLRGVESKVPQMGNYQQLLKDYALDAENLSAWMHATVQVLEHAE